MAHPHERQPKMDGSNSTILRSIMEGEYDPLSAVLVREAMEGVYGTSHIQNLAQQIARESDDTQSAHVSHPIKINP